LVVRSIASMRLISKRPFLHSARAALFGITPSAAWASQAWASISSQIWNFASGDQIAVISGRE
jgi:hypothetical protein